MKDLKMKDLLLMFLFFSPSSCSGSFQLPERGLPCSSFFLVVPCVPVPLILLTLSPLPDMMIAAIAVMYGSPHCLPYSSAVIDKEHALSS